MRRVLAAVLLAQVWAPPRAWATDSGSLQFTIPAPDPVQAGETVSFQALAVNTGADPWTAGSYYWVADIYDLDYKFLARTKQVTPTDAVAPGGIAAISLTFPIPATMAGRKLYRVFLIKDARTLVRSEYKPFQIVEKVLPPPPPPQETVDYRVEGNVTLTYRNTSHDAWKEHKGATTMNIVGKLKESSFLFNGHLIHEPGKVVDPFILLLTYYAPWGRVYAGDVSPTLSVLSVNGQGMRGLMLEQQKDNLEWSALGGQTVTSQAGTVSTNGRYARSLFAGKLAWQALDGLKANFDLFHSADETGSLSTDPKSSNFRGPTLKPQKNTGAGFNLAWQALDGGTVLADYQKNSFFADSGGPGVSDTAWRGEFRLDKKAFRLGSFIQRAGTNFVSFAAPGVVGDRMTFDGSLSLFPSAWYTLNLSGNQYKDNLAGNPQRLTTTQRTLNLGNAFQFRTGTALGLNAVLNTAKGKPATALDNRTTTLGLNVSQALERHSFSAILQTVRFRDKNKLAHDLDTATAGLTANVSLPWTWRGTFGVNRSNTKDKVDGSKRTSQSSSLSVTFPIAPLWSGQVFGTFNQSKNSSPLFPSNTSTTSANTEFTWSPDNKTSFVFGPGYNKSRDTAQPSRNITELTISMRYSQSF